MSRAPRRLAAGAALAAAALGALAIPASAAKDDLDLVSQATGGAPADAASSEPSISADGRYVALASDANNLAGPQLTDTPDVFLRDMVAGTTTLVSRGADPALGPSYDPAISADGSRVAFTSEAGNLSDDDASFPDVFVRDLRTNATILVSRSDGAAGAGLDGISNLPAISADGRFVAFVSDGDAPGAVGGVSNVFVRDLALNTTVLASRAPNGAGGDRSSSAPAISADGRYVAFLSDATNLSTEDAAVRGVFVRDLVAETTTLVSRATGPSGAPASGESLSPSISADGTRVAFATGSPNLSGGEDLPGSDVFVRDLAASATILVSRATGPTGPPADAPASDPVIAADGRSVAFRSGATNLSAEDLDGVIDVFARDLSAHATTLVSRAAGAAGASGNAPSGEPSISSSGRYVAFSSDADNLSGADSDGWSNVFRRDVAGVAGAVAPPSSPVAAAASAPAASARPTARCAGRLATIVGTARRDVIRGTGRSDVIAALGGDDVVLGAAGNDLICLGAGTDRAHGGRGADLVRGGPGRDLILGGPGPDLLIGNAALDLARGGRGADICHAEGRLSC
ncbi:MAG: calcium-binding protein [Thermoleophilia bacterium]